MKKVYFVFILSLMTSIALFGQTKNWIGGTGDWDVPANWNPTGVPTGVNDITIYSGVATVNTNANVKSIVLGSGAQMNVGGFTLTITGATANGIRNFGTIVNDGTINITSCGQSAIKNESGATFTNGASGSLVLDDVSQPALWHTSGTFINDGYIGIAQNTAVAHVALQNEANFTNNATIAIGSASGSIGLWGIYNTASGTFTNDGGDISINNTISKAAIDNRNIFTNMNNGTINIGNTVAVQHRGIDNYGAFANTANIVIDQILYEAIYTNSGSTFSNSGVINTNGGGSSSMWVITGSGGTFNNEEPGIIHSIEDIVGTNFTNSGTLSPGNSPGRLNIRNIYNSTSTAKLSIELGGTTVDTEYDRLHFYNAGAANFDISNTSLEVVLINGFVPAAGNSFDVLTSTYGYTGTFAATSLPTLAANLEWEVDYTTDPNRVTLRVNSTLPLDWISFRGKAESTGNLLQWETTNEINTLGFEILRKPKLDAWEKIGFIASNEGFRHINEYSFMDEEQPVGTQWYRLKQIDMDGQFELSDVISITRQEKGKELSIYPNPSANDLYVKGLDLTKNSYMIMDYTGRIILEGVLTANESMIDVSQLKSGYYVLKLENEYKKESIDFYKQ